jgi:hypothetical protein
MGTTARATWVGSGHEFLRFDKGNYRPLGVSVTGAPAGLAFWASLARERLWLLAHGRLNIQIPWYSSLLATIWSSLRAGRRLASDMSFAWP